jgi:hypothetical protein
MDITFSCRMCGQRVVIDEAGAGQLVDCPKCGTSLEVPHGSPAVTPNPSRAAAGNKKCPFCAETIKAEALICRFCRTDLRTGQPLLQKAVVTLPRNTFTPTRVLIFTGLLVVGIALYNVAEDGRKDLAKVGISSSSFTFNLQVGLGMIDPIQFKVRDLNEVRAERELRRKRVLEDLDLRLRAGQVGARDVNRTNAVPRAVLVTPE